MGKKLWRYNCETVILGDPEAVSWGQNEVNRGEIEVTKVFMKSGKSPWGTSHSRPFPNASANAGGLLIEQKKTYVVFCPIGVNVDKRG